jgi:ABC-2 type transport system permease protein
LSLLAYLLYTCNIFDVGVALVPFMANLLLFGWAVGMGTMALVLRFGRAAEALVWGIPFLLQPVSAVYYPLDVLPPGLQTLAWLLPSTHVFEGMRTALHLGTVPLGSLLVVCGLNLVYLAGGAAIFAWMIRYTREKGYLSRFGMQ